jgi:dihydroorotase
MQKTVIQNATIVNEGKSFTGSVLISGERIEHISSGVIASTGAKEINGEGLMLIPGAIDDQVHFREPGLTHKASIHTESRAAVAGGITSFMEMPNTVPSAITIELLEQKYTIASQSSPANYSFYMGTTNSNIEEVKKVNPKTMCGVKIFMGSSTGDMLVDSPEALEAIFRDSPAIITTHCEVDGMVKNNLEAFKNKYGEENLEARHHSLIRSREACYESSSFAISLAKKHNSRLHVLHISTAEELALFSNALPLEQKRITAEACVHHLWFTDEDYARLGNFIKWNPSVKTLRDREAIRQAVNDDIIDVIATDHAPHTLEEKQQSYVKAPSGGPLVQHSVLAVMDLCRSGVFTYEKMVQKMCHFPATLFRVEERGFIREGYYADLVLINPNRKTLVSRDSLLYKCGWSPFEGHAFSSAIERVFVNGNSVYENGKVLEGNQGKRLSFSA